MKYTNRIIVDQIIRRINGGDPLPDGGGVHPNDVLAAIGEHRTKAVWEKHFNDRREGEIGIDDSFVVVYEDCAVEFSNSRGLYFTELPVIPLDLPRGMGLYHVGPMKDPFTQYVIRKPGHLAISAASDARDLGGIPYCWQEGKKIFFGNVNIADAVVDKVLLKIVPGLEWMDMDSEQIGIPGSMVEAVIEIIVQKLGGQRQVPQDKAVDGNKTP